MPIQSLTASDPEKYRQACHDSGRAAFSFYAEHKECPKRLVMVWAVLANGPSASTRRRLITVADWICDFQLVTRPLMNGSRHMSRRDWRLLHEKIGERLLERGLWPPRTYFEG